MVYCGQKDTKSGAQQLVRAAGAAVCKGWHRTSQPSIFLSMGATPARHMALSIHVLLYMFSYFPKSHFRYDEIKTPKRTNTLAEDQQLEEKGVSRVPKEAGLVDSYTASKVGIRTLLMANSSNKRRRREKEEEIGRGKRGRRWRKGGGEEAEKRRRTLELVSRQ